MYPQNQNQAAPQAAQQQGPSFAFAMDEASAMDAGKEAYITETGAYSATIERVQYCQASTGTHGMMFRFITLNGMRGSFILNYQMADGKPLFGKDLINAILYLTGVPGFNWVQELDEKNLPIQVAKELEGRQVGFAVESVKNINDEGRHLELRQAFDYTTGCSASEKKQNLAPTAVRKLMTRLTK